MQRPKFKNIGCNVCGCVLAGPGSSTACSMLRVLGSSTACSMLRVLGSSTPCTCRKDFQQHSMQPAGKG
eukprot:365496-Chlamydomonas_euryale.AAC.2